jgi:hypothetical protein
MIYFIILGLVTLGVGLYHDDIRIFFGIFIIGMTAMAHRAEEVVTFSVCETEAQKFAPVERHGLEALKKAYPSLQCEEVKLSRSEAARIREAIIKTR